MKTTKNIETEFQENFFLGKSCKHGSFFFIHIYHDTNLLVKLTSVFFALKITNESAFVERCILHFPASSSLKQKEEETIILRPMLNPVCTANEGGSHPSRNRSSGPLSLFYFFRS